MYGRMRRKLTFSALPGQNNKAREAQQIRSTEGQLREATNAALGHLRNCPISNFRLVDRRQRTDTA